MKKTFISLVILYYEILRHFHLSSTLDDYLTAKYKQISYSKFSNKIEDAEDLQV